MKIVCPECGKEKIRFVGTRVGMARHYMVWTDQLHYFYTTRTGEIFDTKVALEDIKRKDDERNGIKDNKQKHREQCVQF